jgi:DNA-binding transcriptional ArsR family regulator
MEKARRDVFQAIADPTRRAIINLVAYQPLNLNTIAENFDVSRPAISQHIKLLAECGLVELTKQGRERFCEARFDDLRLVFEWAEQYRRLWAPRFDLLDDLAELPKPVSKKQDKKKKSAKKKKHKKD